MTIEIDERTAQALEAQAKARGLPLDVYLSVLAGGKDADLEWRQPSLEELNRALDELSADAIDAPSLPADFSRADIYHDHD
jgi:hypothetical protein